MKTYVPIDFYPAPLPLTSGQKRRIRSLVQRGLAGEKVYYTVPRRSLIPLFAILVLCIGIGCAAASPEIRQTAVQAASGVAAAIEKFFNTEEETVPPYKEMETETEAVPDEIQTETEESEIPETDTDLPAEDIQASVTVGDVQLTIDKAIRTKDGLYFHLKLDHLTDSFAGDILQFDALSLAINGDTENKYHNTERWLDLMTLHWGEPGIMAGEVFVLLGQNSVQSAVSYWLCLETDKPTAGEYRLQIGRLFGCDTSAAEFVCTEYGDIEIIFTLDALPEVTQTTRLTPMSVFTIGGMEYTLTSIVIEPLHTEVEITCGRETTFYPDGYNVLLTPIYKLYGMFDAARAMGLTGTERDEFYEQQFVLKPYFSTDTESQKITRTSHCQSFYMTDVPEDAVYFKFTMQEPISPDALEKLVLERMNGGQNIVIWEKVK